MSIEPQEILLSQISEYLEHNFRPLAEHKNLHFVINTSDNFPKTVFTDNNRLQQILKNLLSNAIKFTEKGEVKMDIKVVEKGKEFGIETLDKSPSVLAFSVKDTGIGIPLEKQNIARLLGGMIKVESASGRGSVFTLYLPEKYIGAETVTNRNGSKERIVPGLPKNADFKGKRILIVDDDMRNIYALTSILEPWGMIVTHAENGKAGIRRLKEKPDTDLILMDIMMPEMNGFDAIKMIRKISKFESLPIIALTAKAMKGDREQCLDAGASEYITKPVDTDRLLAVMYSWLNK
jgi:CheY-like chemotaxis protein